ncbi:MAG: transglycosylase domain-containing protein, partial [Polyangiales bacterium]
ENYGSNRRPQGASTITQQVVKNLLLTPEKTYTRKMKEMLLARRIEQELKKDEILELYLNHIYFGDGRYGIEEAARGYFGHHAKDLTLAEASMLAGLVPAPAKYNPRASMKLALERRGFVLGQLLDKGFIKPSAYDAAMADPVKLAPIEESTDDLAPEVVELVRRAIHEAVGDEAARRGGFTVQTTIDPALQRAARAAIREATAAYDKRWKLDGPFASYAIEPDIPAPKGKGKPAPKKKAPAPHEPAFKGAPRFGHGDTYVGVVVGHDDAARTIDVDVGSVRGVVKLAQHERYDPRDLPPSTWAPKGAYLRVSLEAPAATTAKAMPSASAMTTTTASATTSATTPTSEIEERVPLRLELGPQAAMVSIDVRTHAIVAMVGSVEGAVGGLNRATQAHRQPGSTFKPFVYGAAIAAKKITAATQMEATPGEFGGWNPKNYEAWTRDEPVRVREALAASINLVAVRIAQLVGPQAVVDFARRAGITSALKPDLAIALGSYEVTPLELATAYSTFASGGLRWDPTLVVKITSADGTDVPLPKSLQHAAATRAMDEAEAFLMTSLMTSVVDHGTAAGAKVLGRPVAGKTGTSNLAKDTWFAGYTT